MDFNLDEMLAKEVSSNQLMLDAANMARSMSAEERRAIIGECNKRIDSVFEEIKAIEKGRIFSELDEEEVKRDMALCNIGSRLDSILTAMMIPEEVLNY
ncbi:hypothetical protein [uncultured Gemmiger sp.]|uniref:hypothetical protein n=1 Tax=uncultured Gemmiger sp. TaxID=1623490 RepID=UPI0025E74E51|nr:hypothetical protein [uncultured Gemmiger sp.]